MTVYWVDPYLDTSNGGIHGTTGTARSGTYSNPWGFDDIIGTVNEPTSINGTNVTSNDEIRLKGQSLASYYYNIGTTGNKVPITSCPSSGDALVWDSSYNTNVDGWRTAITTANSGDTVGVFVIHDPDLIGTEKWTIASSVSPTQTTGQDRIKLLANHSANPYSAYINALEGITSSKGLEVAFIDPVWIYDYSPAATQYYLNFKSQDNADGMTFTDGWDSETTRNGVTLLILRQDNTNSNNVYIFNKNGSYGITYDLPNTYMLHYHITTSYHSQKYYFNIKHADEDYPFKLGGIINSNTNAWNYWHSNNSSKWETGGADYSVDIRIWGHGRYYFWNANNNSSNPPKIRIQNMFFGQGPYFNGSYYDMYIGNLFTYIQYTGSDFFYTTNSNNTINFLDNGHIFGNNQAMQGIDPNGSIGTVGTGVTITSDQPAKYPGAGSGGPTNGGGQSGSRYFIDTDKPIKLSAENWWESKIVKAHTNTSVISDYDYGNFETAHGILECDSDYNNMNSQLLLWKSTYINTSYFSNQSMTFAKNTYDNKPISLWTYVTTGTNNGYPALISFNDSDDMVVKCTNQSVAANKSYMKSFVYDTPELTGMNTLVFQQDIEKIGTGMTTPPIVNLYPIKKNSAGAKLVATRSDTDSTKWSYSYTFNPNVLDSDVNFIGSSIIVRNNSGADKNSGAKIKPPAFTVT